MYGKRAPAVLLCLFRFSSVPLSPWKIVGLITPSSSRRNQRERRQSGDCSFRVPPPNKENRSPFNAGGLQSFPEKKKRFKNRINQQTTQSQKKIFLFQSNLQTSHLASPNLQTDQWTLQPWIKGPPSLPFLLPKRYRRRRYHHHHKLLTLFSQKEKEWWGEGRDGIFCPPPPLHLWVA